MKMKKNLILLILILLNIVLVLFITIQSNKSRSNSTFTPELPKKHTELENGFEFKIIPFELLIVNLSGEGGRRILKVSYEVKFKIKSPGLDSELVTKKSSLRDSVLTILGESSYFFIMSTAGQNELKRQIIDKFNTLLISANAVDIYFTQLESN